MKELLADTDRRLHFRIEPCGLQLTFPAYVYNFVEDVEARVLHHKIEGSGYPYRECVTRKGVDLLAYDRLFAQVVLSLLQQREDRRLDTRTFLITV